MRNIFFRICCLNISRIRQYNINIVPPCAQTCRILNFLTKVKLIETFQRCCPFIITISLIIRILNTAISVSVRYSQFTIAKHNGKRRYITYITCPILSVRNNRRLICRHTYLLRKCLICNNLRQCILRFISIIIKNCHKLVGIFTCVYIVISGVYRNKQLLCCCCIVISCISKCNNGITYIVSFNFSVRV